MKRKAIARIVLYSILALVLTGILVSSLLANVFMFHINIGGNGTTVEGEVPIEAALVKNIEIDWAAGSVEILAADTDHLTICEVVPEGCKYWMAYALDDETLSISYTKGTFGVGFGNWNIPSKELIITVPKDWICEDLEIDGAALEIDIQDLTLRNFELDGASCAVNFVGVVDRVDIDGASTDIHIASFAPISSIQIDGASCDLNLTLPTGCGFLVELNGLDYGFHCDLDYSNLRGAYAYGDRHCVVNIDGISCDVTIAEGPTCNHEWGPGMPVVDSTNGWNGMMYTCHICGESSTIGPTW